MDNSYEVGAFCSKKYKWDNIVILNKLKTFNETSFGLTHFIENSAIVAKVWRRPLKNVQFCSSSRKTKV